MNITNIQPFVSSVGLSPKNQPEPTEIAIGINKAPETETIQVKIQDSNLPGMKKDKEGSKEQSVNYEEMLFKPSPITLEERMSQVISAEQVKDLLSLITRFSLGNEEEEHSLDVKR